MFHSSSTSVMQLVSFIGAFKTIKLFGIQIFHVVSSVFHQIPLLSVRDLIAYARAHSQSVNQYRYPFDSL